MTLHYDPRAWASWPFRRGSAYCSLLSRPELWVCLSVHVTVVILERYEYIELPEDRTVSWEIVLPLLGVALLCSLALGFECRQRHEAVFDGCARVGEETQVFVQELQVALGRLDEAIPYRFIAAKYALAALYIFFFTITGGTVTGRGWGELHAKGLLDEREIRFVEGQFKGNKIALLHTWALWAANEASCVSHGAFVAAGSPNPRLADAMQRAASAARGVADRIAAPIPHHHFQLHDFVMLSSMLCLGVVSAPMARASGYISSFAYVVALVGAFGLRELAGSLADPLFGENAFPAAVACNATADAVVQLLLGTTPAVFNPCASWATESRAIFTQSQVERRANSASFSRQGGNPCRWPEARSQFESNPAFSPLLDVGCCHLDMNALQGVRRRAKSAYRVSKHQPGQDSAEKALAKVLSAVSAVNAKDGKKPSPGHTQSGFSTMYPSYACSEASVSPMRESSDRFKSPALEISLDSNEYCPRSCSPQCTSSPAGTGDDDAASTVEIMAENRTAAPQEQTLSGNFSGGGFTTQTMPPLKASGTRRVMSSTESFMVSGKWASPTDQAPPCSRSASVSPEVVA